MNRDFWVLKYTQYSGYDCSGHVIMSIYWGTFIEAARECIKLNQGIRRYDERSVSRFELPDVIKRKRLIFVL